MLPRPASAAAWQYGVPCGIRHARAPTPVQRSARWLLALAGWSVDLPWPPEPRGIIVVYPHTSNWDFVVGMLALGTS